MTDYIKKSLMEGGNTSAINRETGATVGMAQKIDMHKVDRNTVTQEFISIFSKLNDMVEQSSGTPIWDDFNIVKHGIAFNGSSEALFDMSISDDEFLKYKPIVGDIDITVPRDRIVDLFDVLTSLEGRKINNMVYVGSNRKHGSEHQQINSLFQYESSFVMDAMIDDDGIVYDTNGTIIPDSEIIKIH